MKRLMRPLRTTKHLWYVIVAVLVAAAIVLWSMWPKPPQTDVSGPRAMENLLKQELGQIVFRDEKELVVVGVKRDAQRKIKRISVVAGTADLIVDFEPLGSDGTPLVRYSKLKFFEQSHIVNMEDVDADGIFDIRSTSKGEDGRPLFEVNLDEKWQPGKLLGRKPLRVLVAQQTYVLDGNGGRWKLQSESGEETNAAEAAEGEPPDRGERTAKTESGTNSLNEPRR